MNERTHCGQFKAYLEVDAAKRQGEAKRQAPRPIPEVLID